MLSLFDMLRIDFTHVMRLQEWWVMSWHVMASFGHWKWKYFLFPAWRWIVRCFVLPSFPIQVGSGDQSGKCGVLHELSAYHLGFRVGGGLHLHLYAIAFTFYTRTLLIGWCGKVNWWQISGTVVFGTHEVLYFILSFYKIEHCEKWTTRQATSIHGDGDVMSASRRPDSCGLVYNDRNSTKYNIEGRHIGRGGGEVMVSNPCFTWHYKAAPCR